MNELIVHTVKRITRDACPFCGGEGKLRIRAVASEDPWGGLVGWITCPLEDGSQSLTRWVEPFIDEQPEVPA